MVPSTMKRTMEKNRIAQSNERELGGVESGSCFLSVRFENLIRLLKLFTKSRQQCKDDQNRVGETHGYIRIQDKLLSSFYKDNMKVWERDRIQHVGRHRPLGRLHGVGRL